MLRTALARRVGAAALAVAAVGGCSSGTTKSEADYCTLVNAHLTELATPAISSDRDVSAVVALYQQVADAAPLAVASEWKTMLTSIKVAADVDPDKPETVQAAADAARQTQVAANRVIAYTQEHCGAVLGLPGNTTAPSTTTVPTT